MCLSIISNSLSSPCPLSPRLHQAHMHLHMACLLKPDSGFHRCCGSPTRLTIASLTTLLLIALLCKSFRPPRADAWLVHLGQPDSSPSSVACYYWFFFCLCVIFFYLFLFVVCELWSP
jgi:hypothetical protein